MAVYFFIPLDLQKVVEKYKIIENGKGLLNMKLGTVGGEVIR